MPDLIHIEELELMTHIGVPQSERAIPQRVTVSLTLETRNSFSAVHDRIENTVDYFEVVQTVLELGRRAPRELLETLAIEIANEVLNNFAVKAVDVELRKYVIPETKFVAVRIHRAK